MTRSRVVSQTLLVVGRYGVGRFPGVPSPFALLAQLSTATGSDPPGANSQRSTTLSPAASIPAGGASRFKESKQYPCTALLLCRRPWDPFTGAVLGSRFFSAQLMPAKAPTEEENQTEKDFAQNPTTETTIKVSASATDVDKALEDYDKVLDQHRKYYATRYDSPSRQIKEFATKTLGFFLTTWRFVLGLPGTVWSATVAPWPVKKAWMSSQWKHIKEGAQHYWVGTKLLAVDLRVASRLVLKVLKGKSLTRRERRQLSRTVADLFRMVPMIILLVVPFLEFLLPVAISLFPNMLPSTFEDKLKKEEQLKKRLTAKLEVAQFLQDTVAVMARDLKQQKTGEVQASADELYQFMKDIRRGAVVHNEDIIRFAQLFKDEFTLDNLDRVHLTSLCQLVGLSPFGTDSFLQTKLRAHLGGLKRDDHVIRDEGLDTMTTDELRQASRARAMRALFGDGAHNLMKQRMEEWLELSLDRQAQTLQRLLQIQGPRMLPSSLLLLSRAFTVTQPVHDKTLDLTNLAHTLSTFPDEAVEDVELEVLSDAAGAENAKKLEYIQREEVRIKEEETATAEAEQSQLESTSVGSAQDMAATATAAAVLQAAEVQVIKDAIQDNTEESAEEISAKMASFREQKLKKVLSALAVLTSSSGVSHERSKFMELVRKEIDRIQGEMTQHGGASLRFTSRGFEAWRPAEAPELPEEIVSKRLQDRVTQIMHKIEKDMDRVDGQIGGKMHICDLDGDGMISLEELQTALGHLREQLGEPELKLLLEELCKSAQKDSGIDVNRLMELAQERFEPDAFKESN